MKAELEALGDVKLYRIPEPVTVAANSQKQVALIEQSGVAVRIVHRSLLSAGNDGSDVATRYLVTRNRTQEGLGLPLPAGGVVLFSEAAGRPLLIGEGSLRDTAVGEDVEIRLDPAPGVRAVQRMITKDRYALVVTNDSPTAIRYEAEFAADDRTLRADTRLGRRNGRALWAVTIPANGSATLRYRVRN